MVNATTRRIAARFDEKLADTLSRPFPAATRRIVRGPHTIEGRATAVIGMRRAGKTTFLHQLRRARHEAGTPREQMPYVSFEDEQLAGMKSQHLTMLIESFYRRFPALRGSARVTWCLDEIQVVPGWERFVRRLLDEEVVEVLLSGSSARLLSREIATSMRGRAWEVVVHPFSFREFLLHHGRPVPVDASFLSSSDRSHLERALLDYLAMGGFPEVQRADTDTRERMLLDYVDVVMMRDIVERHGVTNIVVLRWLVRHLLGNPASMFSVEKFHAAMRSQGLRGGRDTVHALLSHLEDCFLVRTLWVEANSERQRMVNRRKVYPIDTGLVAVFDHSGKANVGHALETVVLLELERRGRRVTYVRTESGHEVDFLARGTGTMELIQVCADASNGDTAQRELRALTEAKRRWPEALALLIVATREGMPPDLPAGVVAKPAYEWLLAAD
jgi:uncharacterized protein